jgi:hypothetical protein
MILYKMFVMMTIENIIQYCNVKLNSKCTVLEIGTAILEYQKFGRSVRMKGELVPVGTMRSIQEILNDDECISVSIVMAVSKQLAEYLRLLHSSFIAFDQICATNIYIKLYGGKVYNFQVSFRMTTYRVCNQADLIMSNDV